MINYEIMHINTTLMTMQVKYSLEGNNDYFARMSFESPIKDEELHFLAKRNVVQAEAYWDRETEAEEFTLSSATGVAKRTIISDRPDFHPDAEKFEEYIEETDEEVIYRWRAVPLEQHEKIAKIRHKRDALLQSTDSFALSDRPVSDEMLAYRKALREIPQQESFPENVSWPILPID